MKEIKKDNPTENQNLNRQILAKSFIRNNLKGKRQSLKVYLDGFEKEIILYALKISNGNKKNASRLLNIQYKTLLKKINRLEIQVDKQIFFENLLLGKPKK